jgi:O-methyltransferase involved in polyketide biosynthesis
MYLTESAIDGTLRCITRFPKGSEAVITFLPPPWSSESSTSDLANRVSDVGEPFISYFTAEEFTNKLLSVGFCETHLITSSQAALYFAGNHNPLPIPKSVNIVSAIV